MNGSFKKIRILGTQYKVHPVIKKHGILSQVFFGKPTQEKVGEVCVPCTETLFYRTPSRKHDETVA